MNEYFVAGSVAALEAFRSELLRNRGHIENEVEPAFDVIVELLDLTLAGVRAAAPDQPSDAARAQAERRYRDWRLGQR